MKKNERIAKYGVEAYAKKLEQVRAWRESHPQKVIAGHREQCRKGGKHYAKTLIHDHTGLRGERHKIRDRHGNQWRPYKHIIAPESQVHHQWIPETSKYTGVALVEAEQHMHGIIDVIKILEGEITLFTEEEVAGK